MKHRHPDPRFPDRPDHPDFWALSEIICDHDRMCDESTDEESGMAKTFRADIRSVGYMANQRAARVQDLLGDATERERLVIMWLDAFNAGQRFGEERAAKITVDDSQHRTAGP